MSDIEFSNFSSNMLSAGSSEQFLNGVNSPIAPPQVTQQLSENVVLTTVDDLYNWASHKMKPVSPIFTGDYLRSPQRQAPPPEIAAALGLEVPPALQTQMKREPEIIQENANTPLNAEVITGSSDVGA